MLRTFYGQVELKVHQGFVEWYGIKYYNDNAKMTGETE